MGSADDRRLEVLRAIVADFVHTQEPVGSKSLVDRHNLGVSSATVRNDMAVLEAEGYIAQPHTSSGRVPTEKGYREFVDRLDGVKPLSGAERRAILSFLESGVDLDDVLRRAVRTLAQLTRQVAIVQYPRLSSSTVRHLEVIALTPARLRSEEHTSELQSRGHLVCRLLLEKKKIFTFSTLYTDHIEYVQIATANDSL